MDSTDHNAPRFFRISERANCTRSLYFLSRDYVMAMDSFFFTVNVVTHADRAAKVASKALAKAAATDDERKKYEESALGPDRGFEQLKKYASVNSQNLVTSINQAFSCYIAHIIRSALRRNDNMLRSRESISIDEIIDFKSKRDLVAYLIDRKVNELSYGGMRQLEQYLADRLGLTLFENDEERDLQVIFNEIRNVIVHNRGYVNDVFLSRVRNARGFTFERNKRYHADLDDIGRLSSNCMKVAQRFDGLVAAKFKIDRKRYATWLKQNPSYIE